MEDLDCGRNQQLTTDLDLEVTEEMLRTVEQPLFADRYRIVGELGSGAMGEVKHAIDEALGRSVALKIMKAHLGSANDGPNRMIREANALQGLHHDNIVRVLDVGILDSGAAWIAMEYLRGRTLAEALLDGPMDSDRAMNIIHQLLGALHHVHRAGWLHRDLKPSNVMLVRQGGRERAVLIDFGVAKPQHTHEPQITQHGFLVGTGYSMAPEQIMGCAMDGRADQYSVAAVLYRVLCGRWPYVGKNFIEIALGHVQGAPPVLCGPAEGHSALNAVLQRAMSKRPTDRYPTVEAFGEALRESCADTPPGLETVKGPWWTPHWVRTWLLEVATAARSA